MKKHWLSLVQGTLLMCISLTANAMQTAWEVKGHLTSVTGTFANQFIVGDAFRILVSFDTSEALVGARAGLASGTRYTYGAESLSYRIEIGSACAPCEPANDPAYNPAASSVLVRDNYADSGPPLDGYTFNLVTGDGVTINLLMRGTAIDMVNGPGLAAVPDARLAQADVVHELQVCATLANDCGDGEIHGVIEFVSSPTFGTNYTLSARDCAYIDSTTASSDPLPRDCILVDASGTTLPRAGRKIDIGGGLGVGEFSRTTAFNSDWTTNYPVTGASLGTTFGAISFSGPSGLPVLKASALPTDISRLNSNLLGYQRYAYNGPATTLPLVINLGYGVADHSIDTAASAEIGLRPGGAGIGVTLAIVDGNIPMPALANNINTLTCGAESSLTLPDGSPWPPGSILGSAIFDSPAGQIAAATSTILDVRSCANPANPVQLAANQSFIVATSIQAPARGKWSTGTQAAANGYVDASHTMRVTFDPNAPPALVQQLADSIAPQCTTCFAPEVTPIAVDATPGSTTCINPRSNGVIAVAILGSPTFDVRSVRQDGSLKLGALSLRARSGKPLCSFSDVNHDGAMDLLCNFDNAATNWTSGQTSVAVTGKLYNGLPILGSDAVCVK